MAFGRTSKASPQPTRSGIAGSPVPPAPARAPDVKPSPVEIKQMPLAKSGPGQAPRRATVEDVRRRAYDIYLARRASGAPGGPESDWGQAERELNIRA